MRRYTYETVVPTTPSKLYRALVDINRWPEWDHELEKAALEGAPVAGAKFTLKPKGGPNVAMSIEEAKPDALFVDVSHLPLAKMRTTHALEPDPAGARLKITIEVWGALGFLWDRVVARKQMQGIEAQTLAFVRFAEATAS